MILSITPPPSVNNLYPTIRGRRVKSPAYRAWLAEAGWEITKQRPKLIEGPVEISITCPENARRDLDGHLKPVLDLLVSMRLIEDDRCKFVRKIQMQWGNDPACLITIATPIDGDAPKRRTGSPKRATAGKP